MSILSLYCLDHFTVKVRGQPTSFRTDKVRALLVYLALEPRPHRREALAALLWPEIGEKQAQNNLRSTLHRLRQSLQAGDPQLAEHLISSSRQTVSLDATHLQCDVHQFTALLNASAAHVRVGPTKDVHLAHCAECLARLTQAAELYQGELLAGFTLVDAPAFEEWLFLRREALHQQMVVLLFDLATASMARTEWALAQRYVRRLLALEPWREEGHRLLMQILARSGQRSAALAHYEQCRQVLKAELGVEPDGETLALVAQIRAGGEEQVTERAEVQKAEGKRQETRAREQKIEYGQVPSVSHSALYDWREMPAIEFFVERRVEIAQLTAWLAPTAVEVAPARLISILGMGGMGKTTLAAVVTKAVAPNFAVVIWRSLLNAPPLNDLLCNWLQVLTRQSLTAPPDTLDEQLRLLLTYLQQERCLLVLDNVESIFAADNPQGHVDAIASRGHLPSSVGRAGVTRPGYEGYDQLFQRLANSEHQSCLLLTSREQPYALVRAGRQAQTNSGRLRVLPLNGLDQAAGHALLQSNGLYTTAAEAARLIDAYSGNPLALQIVAATITDFFGGDVAAFQQEESQIFDGVRLVLDQQFVRLSPLERDILIWLAIEREPISIQTLRANLLQPVTTGEVLEALQALQNRSFLEKRNAGLALQNVILEYMTEHLLTQIYQELGSPQGSAPPILATAFLNRFALMKADAKAYVQQSQARLILRPIAERLRTSWQPAGVRVRVQQILNELRRQAVRTGYAAGNLLNVLIHLGTDLAGFDFSQLSVWQADLRGIDGAALNFAHADLRCSAFTSAFQVETIHFHPEGDLMVAGVLDSDFALWRTADGHLNNAVRSPSNGGHPMCFSQDGQLVAGAGLDQRIRVWSTASGHCVQTLHGHQSTIFSLAISPDHKLLASGTSERFVYLWDVGTGQLLAQLDGHAGGVGALTFSPDSRLLASGGVDQSICLWQLGDAPQAAQLQKRLPGHSRELGALAFSHTGAWLASGDHGGAIRLWAMVDLLAHSNEGEERDRAGTSDEAACILFEQGHRSIIRTLRFHPNGQLLASGSADHTVRLWWRTGQVRWTLTGHLHEVEALAFTEQGHLLASSSFDQNICLWDTDSGQLLHSFHAYQQNIIQTQFSPDGKGLACGSGGRIVLWQLTQPASSSAAAQHHSTSIEPSGRVIGSPDHFVYVAAFTPDGRLIATGGADHTVRLWEVTTGKEVQRLQGHRDRVSTLAFSPNGRWLASAGHDHTIWLWSLNGHERRYAQPCYQLSGHTTEVKFLLFSPDSRTLFSGSVDGPICRWDVEHGTSQGLLAGGILPAAGMALSPDGRTLATINWDQTLRLIDTKSGECFAVRKTAEMGIHAIAFAPAGEMLAYSGNDFALYLWRWRSDEPPIPLRGHIGKILTLDFHPTAPLLVSGAMDGALRLWHLPSLASYDHLRPPGPYHRMNIAGVTGISEAQKAALRTLGAVEG